MQGSHNIFFVTISLAVNAENTSLHMKKKNVVFVKFHLKKYWNKLKGNKVHTSVNKGLTSQAAIVSQRRGRALAKGK